ncbi:MAG: hypothetical protein IJU72_07165 [Bacteroidales bacterium]|nr:hypothetical protein [Bacteroidales bacterium]
MKKLIITPLLALLCAALPAGACTSFIISGRATPDGRPMLFKNRDTDNLRNALVAFADGKYRYVGVVNSDSTWRSMVWGGYNETGFAIINTAAYNNNIGDTTKLVDREGVLMKLALQCCCTLQDFERLLDTLRRPMGVDANFGVIDAHGGAAYYETGNFRYIKFDANMAPDGIIIRTNYSESFDRSPGYGFCRFGTAREAIDEALAAKNLTPRFLFNSVSRSLKHALTRTDLLQNIPQSADQPDFRFFTDYISRYSTSSSMLIVGANAPATARATTMWTAVGFPFTTAVVPVWLDTRGSMPAVAAMRPDDMLSPLCAAGLTLKGRCFPLKHGNARGYIDLAALVNQQRSGIMQQLDALEDEVFSRAEGVIVALAKGGRAADSQVADYYRWLDAHLTSGYRRLFGLELL